MGTANWNLLEKSVSVRLVVSKVSHIRKKKNSHNSQLEEYLKILRS